MHISNKQTNIQTTSKEMAPADGKQSLATAEKTPKNILEAAGFEPRPLR